ncbi:MAG: guanylate kinase [Simkaniaceae bacterium]|nr:guanylate kinase [Simkaniaceae bacterium]
MNKKTPSLVGNLPQGLVFVISAPAGTGKSTLAHMLCDYFAPHVVESTSCTTRKPRKKEVPGQHYHFMTKEDFLAKKDRDEFLEYAEVFGHYYGTLKKDVEQIINSGKHIILVIDTQGALKLKEFFKAVFVFIAPPSLEELKKRLGNRKTESDAMILERLKWAETEIERAEHYDYFIVNEKLDMAFEILKSIMIAEEYRNRDLL